MLLAKACRTLGSRDIGTAIGLGLVNSLDFLEDTLLSLADLEQFGMSVCNRNPALIGFGGRPWLGGAPVSPALVGMVVSRLDSEGLCGVTVSGGGDGAMVFDMKVVGESDLSQDEILAL